MKNVHKLLVAAIVAGIGVGNLSAESIPAWKKVVPSATSIAQGNAVYNEFVADHSHLGVDIMARCGDPIYPLFSGKVKKIAKDTNGLGYAIMIEHDNELYTIALHMQGLPNVNGKLLKVGDSVDSVRSIGKIGNTGFAKGCHTHFEIRNFYHEYNIDKGFLNSSNDGWYHNRSKRCSDGKLNIYACGDVSNTTWAKTDWEDPETFMVPTKTPYAQVNNIDLAWTPPNVLCAEASKWVNPSTKKVVADRQYQSVDGIALCQSYNIPTQCTENGGETIQVFQEQ